MKEKETGKVEERSRQTWEKIQILERCQNEDKKKRVNKCDNIGRKEKEKEYLKKEDLKEREA